MPENNYIYKPQISEIDAAVFWTTFGKNTRIELKSDAFAIDKLSIGLQKLDDNNHQLAYINCYMDLPKALVMANDILSGRFAKMAKPGEITKVFAVQGGQSAARAKRADGKPLYREFSLSKGQKWIAGAILGPGKENPTTHGIVADGKPEQEVKVGILDDDIKAMALMIKAEYEAYRTAQWMRSLQVPASDVVYA
jgi:hypothetical protein